MPGIFHRPLDRRSFLHVTATGVAATMAGFRTPSHGADLSSETAEWHLALISDTHIPADRTFVNRGFNPWENLRNIVPEIVAVNPDAVIHNGDAACVDGKTTEYAEVKQLLAPLAKRAPIYLTLGNHDDRPAFCEAFPAVTGTRQKVTDKQVLVIEHPLARVVLLDSLLYVNKSAGLLGKEQRQWLADYLPKQTDRPVVVFVHHSLGNADNELLDAPAMFSLFRLHPQVKAVFYGHSHIWEVRDEPGLKLINLPAVGYNFNDREPVGWVDARFRKDGVQLTLHAVGGNRKDDGRVVRLNWS